MCALDRMLYNMYTLANLWIPLEKLNKKKTIKCFHIWILDNVLYCMIKTNT